MDYYPVHLRLRGRKAILYGGGRIALRKLTGLLDAGAEVRVISKRFLPQFIQTAEEGEITLVQDGYSPSQLEDVFLVIAATSDREVNKAITREAACKNILVNDCSDAKNSSFINPAVWEKGDLVMTCSTAGEAPAQAKRFKQRCLESCQLNETAE